METIKTCPKCGVSMVGSTEQIDEKQIIQYYDCHACGYNSESNLILIKGNDVLSFMENINPPKKTEEF